MTITVVLKLAKFTIKMFYLWNIILHAKQLFFFIYNDIKGNSIHYNYYFMYNKLYIQS